MATSELQLQIRAVNQASQELAKVSRDLRQMGTEAAQTRTHMANLKGSSDSLFGSLSRLGVGIGIGAALGTAFAQLPQTMASFAHAAADDAASVVKLKTAVENSGGAWDKLGASMDSTVKTAQKMGYEDETARNALALLVAQTDSAAEAQKRFKLAMDLSRGTSLDLETASRLLGKVTDENVTALNRYGIYVQKGASETELFAAVQRKFAGQAQAFADSQAGAFARAQVASHEFAESMGRLVLPAFTQVATVGANAANTVGGLADEMTGIGPAFLEAGKGVVLFGGALAAIQLGTFIRNMTLAKVGALDLQTILSSTALKVGILAAGFVALDQVSQATTGQTLLQRFTSSDEKARGAAEGVKAYTEAIDQMNKAEAAGVSASVALHRAISSVAADTEKSIQDVIAAQQRFNDSPGLKIGGHVVVDLDFKNFWHNTSQEAKDALETIKAKQDALIASWPQLVAASNSPGAAFADLRKQVNALTAGMAANDPVRKKLEDGLLQTESAAIAASTGLDDVNKQVGSLAYNVGRAANAGRPMSNVLDDIASQADAAATAADSLASAFNDLEKIFKRPTLEGLQLQAQIDSTQALIDKYKQMGEDVPADLQKLHDALVANKTVADDVAKVAGNSADILAKKFQDAGIPVDNLKNLLGSMPSNVAIDVVTKLEGLSSAQEAERVVEYLAANPDVPVTALVKVAGIPDAQEAERILKYMKDHPSANIDVVINTANAENKLRGLMDTANNLVRRLTGAPAVEAPPAGRVGGSYAEGGFGSFGTGQLAILHGREAILPLDKPQRARQILGEIGVRGYQDGGYTTGNLPPSLQAQYERLGLVSGASGGGTGAGIAKQLSDAQKGLIALSAAFQQFQRQTGGTEAQFLALIRGERTLAVTTDSTTGQVTDFASGLSQIGQQLQSAGVDVNSTLIDVLKGLNDFSTNLIADQARILASRQEQAGGVEAKYGAGFAVTVPQAPPGQRQGSIPIIGGVLNIGGIIREVGQYGTKIFDYLTPASQQSAKVLDLLKGAVQDGVSGLDKLAKRFEYAEVGVRDFSRELDALRRAQNKPAAAPRQFTDQEKAYINEVARLKGEKLPFPTITNNYYGAVSVKTTESASKTLATMAMAVR